MTFDDILAIDINLFVFGDFCFHFGDLDMIVHESFMFFISDDNFVVLLTHTYYYNSCSLQMDGSIILNYGEYLN